MVGQVTKRQLQAVAILIQGGAASSGAISVIANFSWECGSPNLPTAFRTGRLDHGSQGLAQWRLDRLTKYMDFVADKHPDLDGTDRTSTGELWPWFGRLDYQLEFTIQEMKNDYRDLWDKIAAGGDVAALTADVCFQYERPNRAQAHLADRVAYAKSIAAGVTSTTLPTDVTTHIASEAHAHDRQQQGAVAAAGAPVAIAVAAGLSSISDSIPWWGWIGIGLLIFVFVAGVMGIMKASAAATNVKATAAAVTNTPAPTPAQPVEAAKPATVVTHKVDAHRANAVAAQKDEAAVLNAALTGTVQPTTTATVQVVDGRPKSLIS